MAAIKKYTLLSFILIKCLSCRLNCNNRCVVTRAACQSPTADTSGIHAGRLTSKHHWSANWGGGDILQCLFFCRGQRKTCYNIATAACHSPFLSSTSLSAHYLISPSLYHRASSPSFIFSQPSYTPRQSAQSQVNDVFNYHCSAAFWESSMFLSLQLLNTLHRQLLNSPNS